MIVLRAMLPPLLATIGALFVPAPGRAQEAKITPDDAPTRAAAVAATQPTPDSTLRSWFVQLGDRDPAVRDLARQHLMGLQRSQLGSLRRIVADARPLAPAQATALRDIVTHVFLAGESYAVDRNGRGFMGVRLADVGGVDVWDPRRGAGGAGGAGANDAGEDGIDRSPGVVITERIPGFGAYRMLDTGDVILAIRESPAPIVSTRALIDVIQSFRAHQTIHLRIARAGRVVEVPLTLDPRPSNADGVDFTALWQEHRQRAAEFWEQSFAPLLDEVSS